MRFFRIFALLVALNIGAWIIPQEAPAQQSVVSFQLFYDELSPYGMWVDYPNYGFVWIPNAEPGFSPYATNGRWIYTDDGWTWVSDYPWGWAPFHYGRWDYDNVYGWFWVPDNEWGPAWVSWRRSPGYYGWAPMRPGISINIAFGRDYHERNERWIFVRDKDISRSDIGHQYIDRSKNTTIINNSTVIVNTQKDSRHNVTYISGPERNDVQKITNTTVKPVTIREIDRPGQRLNNGELQLYRPQVQKKSGNGQNPAPSKVIKLNDVKPASERNAENRQQQPNSVSSPNKGQPTQPQNVKQTNNLGNQKQPQTVAPSKEVQPMQPRAVNPSNSQGNRKQLQTVASPKQIQPIQPRAINPSNSQGKQKQSQKVAPPNKSQPTQPKVVKPSNSQGKQKQPQKVAPPSVKREPQPSQPKANQEEKEKRER